MDQSINKLRGIIELPSGLGSVRREQTERSTIEVLSIDFSSMYFLSLPFEIVSAGDH